MTEKAFEYSFERVKITGGIGADDEYWKALERGEFRLPRCSGCGRWTWPAHFRCGECGSWDFDWAEVKPEGIVFSWTRSWYAFDRVSERADDLPYVTLLVELSAADGARVLGMLKGPEDGLSVGAPVRGVVEAPTYKSKGYPSMVWELTR